MKLNHKPPWSYRDRTTLTLFHNHCKEISWKRTIVFTIATHNSQNGGSHESTYHTEKLIEFVPIHVLVHNFSGSRTRMLFFLLFVLLACIGDSQSLLSNQQYNRGKASTCSNGTALTFVSYGVFESVSVRYQMVPFPEQAHSVHKWRMLSITHPTSSIPVCVETSPDDAYTLRMEP